MLADNEKGDRDEAIIAVAQLPSAGANCLVLSVSVDLPTLHSLGKNYPWPRPERCPRCQGLRLWGHGYVARYFDGEPHSLWMKRWRCVDCGAVHTARAATHWRGFLCPCYLILASLLTKLVHGRWVSLVSRQRQQYWRRGYLCQRQIAGGLLGVQELYEAGIIVATHSLSERWVHPLVGTAHPRFAATATLG